MRAAVFAELWRFERVTGTRFGVLEVGTFQLDGEPMPVRFALSQRERDCFDSAHDWVERFPGEVERAVDRLLGLKRLSVSDITEGFRADVRNFQAMAPQHYTAVS